jgi:hypothetical protein
MTKKRNRSRGRERERLMEVAVANEAAAVIDRWLASPGLRTPK